VAAKSPSFTNLQPASVASSRSKKANGSFDTRHEYLLRHHLWRLGLRYRKNVRNLPGKPDVAFPSARVVVFCDGDFWHGRNWSCLREKLEGGTNADYWKAKIAMNRQHDQRVNEKLRQAGWKVVRLWEGDILKDPVRFAAKIYRVIESRLHRYGHGA